MKRIRTHNMVLSVLVLIGSLLLYFDHLEVHPVSETERIIRVPENYSTIQEAINHANPGDTILVSAKTYVENVVVNKSVSIISENRYTTVVDGNGTGTGFYVAADNVSITNFTIKNCFGSDWETCGGIVFDYSFSNINISNNIILNNSYGILVRGSEANLVNNLVMDCIWGVLLVSHHSFLRSNNITGCYYNFGVGRLSVDWYITNDVDISNKVNGKSIYYLKNQKNITIDQTTYHDIGYLALINSTDVTIKDLSLKNNYNGILLAFTNNTTVKDILVQNNTYGISLEYSNANFLNNITASDNYSGISLSYSSWNEINNCFVTNNGYGISLFGFLMNPSHSNKIFGNTICNNFARGLQTIDSGGNQIYHNNFINNSEQAYVEEYGNTWDDGYPSGGNYWSDYVGVDLFSGPHQNETEGDGIGDTPYSINADSPDRYPLMNPWPSKDIAILNVSFSKQTPKIGEIMYIYVTIRNKGDLNETFDVGVNYTRVSDPLIGIKTITLNFRETTTLIFAWTPKIVGVYEIKAYTSEVPNDVHPEDNTKIVYIKTQLAWLRRSLPV